MQEIQMFLKNNIKIRNEKLKKTILEYFFLVFSNKKDFEENENIVRNIQRSKVLIINHYQIKSQNDNILHFVIGFKSTIAIINQQLIKPFIYNVQKNNKIPQICFLNDTKSIFDQFINEPYIESIKESNFERISAAFNKEIHLIKSPNNKMNEIWPIIQSCIIGYLIKQANDKLNVDREFNYNQNKNISNINRIIKEDEYITIDYIIGNGSLFEVQLIYLIKEEEFCLIKRPHVNDVEIPKLIARETNNYKKISHQYLPKYYGAVKGNYPVIEFINGQQLTKIKSFHFSDPDKMIIIFQLLTVIGYLHNNNFIYRDLKPDNVIIDSNKKLALIDFDRMIEGNVIDGNNDRTNEFSNVFNSPEINEGNLTKKSDIYSIGQMIYFIIKEKVPDNNCSLNFDFIGYPNIRKLYNSCISINAEERPTIKQILNDLYHNFMFIYKNNSINLNQMLYYQILAANINQIDAQFYLGQVYQNGIFFSELDNKSTYCFSFSNEPDEPEYRYKYISLYYDNFISIDIDKSIYYYSQAANQHHKIAQYNLGLIFYANNYIAQNIEKAIYYFSLAANQNNVDAQFYLGLIYEKSEFIQPDINKAIYYYSLAANNNNSMAQYNLGLIYYNGKYITRDINKAIYYFSCAANMNDAESQYCLAAIYFSGIYVSKDINKAIHYFTLAANQKHAISQFNLGIIYYADEDIPRDINKAIYYLSLAANQNYPNAQYYLGEIYREGKYIQKDTRKSIEYYSLAAKQNFIDAQVELGIIYYEGIIIQQDINKAIYLFEQAADKNDSSAQHNLGLIYSDEKYKSYDINKAIHYFTLSANQNNPNSQYELGLIYKDDYERKKNQFLSKNHLIIFY